MDGGVLSTLVEGDRKIVIDGPPPQRVVGDFEMAVGQADVVQRLARAGHRVNHPKGEQAEVGRGGLSLSLRWLRGFGRRKFDCRRAGIAGRGDRQHAVLAQAKAQVQAVEFQPMHLDLEGEKRQRVEADPAPGRRKDRPA